MHNVSTSTQMHRNFITLIHTDTREKFIQISEKLWVPFEDSYTSFG